MVVGLKYLDHSTLASAYPGVKRLARETSLGTRTVRRALAELAAAGWLVEVKRGRTGSATVWRGQFPKSTVPTTARTPPGEDRSMDLSCVVCGAGARLPDRPICSDCATVGSR